MISIENLKEGIKEIHEDISEMGIKEVIKEGIKDIRNMDKKELVKEIIEANLNGLGVSGVVGSAFGLGAKLTFNPNVPSALIAGYALGGAILLTRKKIYKIVKKVKPFTGKYKKMINN